MTTTAPTAPMAPVHQGNKFTLTKRLSNKESWQPFVEDLQVELERVGLGTLWQRCMVDGLTPTAASIAGDENLQRIRDLRACIIKGLDGYAKSVFEELPTADKNRTPLLMLRAIRINGDFTTRTLADQKLTWAKEHKKRYHSSDCEYPGDIFGFLLSKRRAMELAPSLYPEDVLHGYSNHIIELLSDWFPESYSGVISQIRFVSPPPAISAIAEHLTNTNLELEKAGRIKHLAAHTVVTNDQGDTPGATSSRNVDGGEEGERTSVTGQWMSNGSRARLIRRVKKEVTADLQQQMATAMLAGRTPMPVIPSAEWPSYEDYSHEAYYGKSGGKRGGGKKGGGKKGGGKKKKGGGGTKKSGDKWWPSGGGGGHGGGGHRGGGGNRGGGWSKKWW